jgi:hypothetical protein
MQMSNISIPNLDLRTACVYKWVENQSSHRRTRTARGIQELRQSTNNAEKRLQEVQCLTARLANDAMGEQWWEERWTLLNGQISLAAPRRPFSRCFDDLPKPRHYPYRPKTTNTWTGGGRRRLITSSNPPPRTNGSKGKKGEKNLKTNRVQWQGEKNVKLSPRYTSHKETRLQRLIAQGCILDRDKKKVQQNQSKDSSASLSSPPLPSPPSSSYHQRKTYTKSQNTRERRNLPPRPSNTPKVNNQRRQQRNINYSSSDGEEDDVGDYSSDDEDFDTTTNGGKRRDLSLSDRGGRNKPLSSLENVPEEEEEDDEIQEIQEIDDEDSSSYDDGDNSYDDDDDDFIQEEDFIQEQYDDDDFIQEDDDESDESVGNNDDQERRMRLERDENRRKKQMQVELEEEQEEQEEQEDKENYIGAQICGGNDEEVFSFLPRMVVPPTKLNISELQLLSSPIKNKKSWKNNNRSLSAPSSRKKSNNAVYLRLSWLPCENTVEYIVERLEANEEEVYDNWLTSYRGPAPLCVLRFQRRRGDRNENRRSNIKFRIIAVDVEGMTSSPSITFQHTIEENKKEVDKTKLKLKSIESRGKSRGGLWGKAGEGVSRKVQQVYQKRCNF